MERLIRKETEERRNKIKESNYNSKYKEIRIEDIPGYLQRKKRRKKRKMIARYKCGNQRRGGQYWRKEEQRICKVCREEEESNLHAIKRCEETKSEITMEELLNRDGNRWEVMKRINRIREEKGKEEWDREDEDYSTAEHKIKGMNGEENLIYVRGGSQATRRDM